MNIEKILAAVKDHIKENDRIPCVNTDVGYAMELVARKKPDGSLYLKPVGSHQSKTLIVLCSLDKIELKNIGKIGC